MPGKYWDSIVDIALDNGGYVTPALATHFAIPAVELRKMVSRGTLTAAGRGIYRVPSLPIDRHDEYIYARLWAMGRGVLSHDSALVVHELCDINPNVVHITVPTAYRLQRSGGQRYAVHHCDLPSNEVTRIEAVVVTTIPRTLRDSLSTVPGYLVRQAVATARERGAIPEVTQVQLLDQLTSITTR